MQHLGLVEREWVPPVPLFFVIGGAVTDERIGVLDDRIITESGIEERVASIVRPLLEAMEYRLVRVNLSGANGKTLQIMAERLDGTMSVQDCEEVSRTISPALDVEDPIDGKYHLEVSSPGIDRPLVRASDFSDWSGHLVKVETLAPIDGKRRYRGVIAEADDRSIRIRRDGVAEGEANEVEIALDLLADARLILTDDLIRESLRRDKAVRKAAKRGEPSNDNERDEASDTDADPGD